MMDFFSGLSSGADRWAMMLVGHFTVVIGLRDVDSRHGRLTMASRSERRQDENV